VPATVRVGDTGEFPGVVTVTIALPDQVYVSDLPWTGSTNGWGPVERDQAVGEEQQGDGPPITLGGVVYDKGLGTNAPASVSLAVDGQCTLLTAVVGIDDSVAEKAAADNVTPRSTFEVLVDDESVFSTVMELGQDPEPISVDVTGAQTVQLRNGLVGSSDTASWHAWADWADALLHCGADTEAPSVDMDVAPQANEHGWHDQAVTVTVLADDVEQSAQAMAAQAADSLVLETAVDGDDWQEYTGPIVLDQEGEHVVEARAT